MNTTQQLAKDIKILMIQQQCLNSQMQLLMATNNASQSVNTNASLSQLPIFPVLSTTHSTSPFPFSTSAPFTPPPTQQPIAISVTPPSLNSNRHPIVLLKLKAKKKARWVSYKPSN
ncbi:hypothetical protein PHYBLDRAFT_150484 [Phycomyces blakesleeanus NRRL 1555(-)]|uniref:Uncharacterized protein n=1 Tax=Phycomyces blakesleeanus (strain ATCC 8743b / DSM 1359 / FGSC 10004 / NBRC 33097 / NRRL 1555) TaxID=763407 RepID=A0A162N411_PHYB8|nr:hypothetical protein PHYBLDRAFT_150484 [Phycomyces blakesleeanus NRRL 1555(-)]OAD68298.1 hypothetical protein PHYBLDRAFT_150484 [Phycomyces blakesleeanus NRRL 1555(-)]|eukprot:XP_018286338.1 hypothetical protein PHYBLDRAFT_150484 [Phycomyces blakesleeanus NRRL 1555(-)]